MRIAVIGAGNVGGTIGEKWAAAGHHVAYGLRDPSRRPGALSFDQALDGAEVVLLAVPGAAVAGFARDYAGALDGRIVIDATNHFGGPSFNALRELAAALPSARLFRAFNTVAWEVFADPVVGDVQADLFYCGPDDPDGEVVERLIADVGLRPVRVGDTDQADTVDGVLRIVGSLMPRRGRRIALK